MKRFFIFIMPLLMHNLALGQDTNKKLSIGDTVPDIFISSIVNYKNSSMKFSDLKNKLIILDFWASWCNPCIEAFSKLDILKKKFGNELQILPITYEKKEDIISFFRKLNKIKHILPLSITDDQILHTYFPYSYLPHYVWLNKNRKVIAITRGSEVNDKNINSFLTNNDVHLQMKSDNPNRVIAKPSKPILHPSVYLQIGDKDTLQEIPDSNLFVHSILTRYIDGLASGARMDSTVVTVENTPIIWLYRVALLKGGWATLNANEIVVDIEDSVLFERITAKKMNGEPLVKPGAESIAWLRKNAFTYEISVPPIMKDEKYDIMTNELNQYFGKLYGIVGKIEKKKKKYLSLKLKSNDERLLTKGGPVFIKSDKFSINIVNCSMNTLIAQLSIPLQLYPLIIDETGYTRKIDINLNCQLSDLFAVNKELEKYGLILEEGEKVTDQAIITKKNTGTIQK